MHSIKKFLSVSRSCQQKLKSLKQRYVVYVNQFYWLVPTNLDNRTILLFKLKSN